MERRQECQRGARGRHAQLLRDRGRPAPGTFQAEHEAAAGACPHDRVGWLEPQSLGALLQPERRASIPERLDLVGVDAHGGMDDRDDDRRADARGRTRVVVLSGVAGIQDAQDRRRSLAHAGTPREAAERGIDEHLVRGQHRHPRPLRERRPAGARSAGWCRPGRRRRHPAPSPAARGPRPPPARRPRRPPRPRMPGSRGSPARSRPPPRMRPVPLPGPPRRAYRGRPAGAPMRASSSSSAPLGVVATGTPVDSMAARMRASPASPSTKLAEVQPNATTSGEMRTSVRAAAARPSDSATCACVRGAVGQVHDAQAGDVEAHLVRHQLPVLAVERHVERHDDPDTVREPVHARLVTPVDMLAD